ncbi:unannotated protein [freshwater metagenome]|uniref:Unannotated protein n=1 Tax=freshwater metagenome TaxID=449393 RepID=A0A6J6UL17_9ZZZZ
MRVREHRLEPLLEKLDVVAEGQVDRPTDDCGAREHDERHPHLPTRLVGVELTAVRGAVAEVVADLVHIGRGGEAEGDGGELRDLHGERSGRLLRVAGIDRGRGRQPFGFGHGLLGRRTIVAHGVVEPGAGQGERTAGVGVSRLRILGHAAGRCDLGLPCRSDLVGTWVGVAIATEEGHEDLAAHVERGEQRSDETHGP